MHDADIELMIFAFDNWNEVFLKIALSKEIIEVNTLCEQEVIDH